MKTFNTDIIEMQYWSKNYTISESGVVTRVSSDSDRCAPAYVGRQLAHEVTQSGYCRVTLCRKGGTKRFQLHRLVAMCHVHNTNPDKYNIVNHKDGDPLNNHKDNLEWTDYSGNLIHAYKVLNRKGPEGESQGHSKLTEKDVHHIRSFITPNYKQLAMLYSVSVTCIYDVVKRRTWNHI